MVYRGPYCQTRLTLSTKGDSHAAALSEQFFGDPKEISSWRMRSCCSSWTIWIDYENFSRLDSAPLVLSIAIRIIRVLSSKRPNIALIAVRWSGPSYLPYLSVSSFVVCYLFAWCRAMLINSCLVNSNDLYDDFWVGFSPRRPKFNKSSLLQNSSIFKIVKFEDMPMYLILPHI